MIRKISWPAAPAMAALALATVVAACGDKDFTENNVVPSLNVFKQTNLVTDVSSLGGLTTDPNLVNPWGLAFGASGALWVANNHTGTSTVYNADGTAQSIVVTIPGAGTPIVSPTGTTTTPTGAPTGVIFNTTASDFTIPGAGSAAFIFAGEDGAISAWNTTTGTSARIVADRSADSAVYKGIAMAFDGTANHIYATNFRKNRVDMFDGSFAFVGAFTDSTLPAGYAPFGIANIGGQLFVTFAKQQGPANVDDSAAVGNGFVDVFALNGALVRRFASNGSLNSPWAVVQAPVGLTPFGGAILIGNFGDGRIGAYDPGTGALIDVLRDASGDAIVISGLWGLTFGPFSSSTTLYFAAGLVGETHGLVGTLTRP